MKTRTSLLMAVVITIAPASAIFGAQVIGFPATIPPGATPPGTAAPDGIGVTMGPSPGVGEMKNGPWVDDSTIHPLQAGEAMPAGSVVRTIEGQDFDLNAAVARQPTILIFYRGGWCPYCNAHLRELQGSIPALKEIGYQVLAVSHDKPSDLKAYLQDQPLDYTLLSDSTMQVSNRFGLGYKVQQGYLDHIGKDRGADVSVTADNAGDQLITPGAYILDQKGTIRFAYVNRNFSVRISQTALLAAARAALAK